MRRALFVAAVGVALVAGSAVPTSAAGVTNTSFTLGAGALAITAPASANLGAGAAGGSAFSGPLGAVSVSDQRGALVATWTASVSSTDFTTGGATAAETIGKANISYWSGLATSTSGVATFTPGQAAAAAAQTLATSRTAYSAAAGTGNNAATWNPTLVVNPPAASVAGDYTGTVTHSVA